MKRITEILAERRGEGLTLNKQHLNTQLVKVLQTIGYNRNYVKAEGPYLFDEDGERYLDLLSGYGVFAMGRNHPVIRQALHDVLDAELPDLVQLDTSLLAGLLGEKLLGMVPPRLDKVFFSNSGTEAVEAAIKFSRAATGRARIVCCDHAFHGLTMGALSLNGDEIFREGFGPLLPGCESVPFNDLAALEAALSTRDVAAFIFEPIQGKGVYIPSNDFLAGARKLCDKYGTLLVADEIQTGLGRTGKLWAVEHWGVEPDMLLTAKALSGGFVPVGAVVLSRAIFDKVFSRMDKAVVHGSTFGKNNMAMAAGLASLSVLEDEKLVENAARVGEGLIADLQALIPKYEFLKEVRGKGMMIGVEFGSPKSLKLKAAWALVEKANKGLFCQMVTIPLFSKHRVLTQVAGHQSHVVKLLPPLVINDEDRAWIVRAMDDVIADCHKVPGSIYTLGKTLAGHALKARSAN